MPGEAWAPAAQRYAVDTSGSTPRFGRVTRCTDGTVFLHPPGGGAEWSASPEELRQPTEDEWARIRVVTTPVPAVGS
ncbi:hypothetical protein ACFQ67_27345 [Streptomyces sp. NPDC056488]|uniref:hypothetical protein n=1 Tax=Streptomyces sp. NPDC056488 TaxID=3345836 RepID=UPI0036C62D16